MLENGHLYGLTETEMASLAGSFFGGGSDTVRCPSKFPRQWLKSGEVSTAIYTVLMAAACFPSEQAKVQVELDEVIGKHRGSPTLHLQFYRFNDVCPKVPTFADQQSLPHLQAFISEALRWRPLAPGGVSSSKFCG
jgi:hypothetical protein